MFKKLLAAIGVGGASVDTRLLNASLQPGQTFEARIVLKGGEVSQSIAGLELALMTRVKVSDGDSSHFINHCLASWRISEALNFRPERRENCLSSVSCILRPHLPSCPCVTINAGSGCKPGWR